MRVTLAERQNGLWFANAVSCMMNNEGQKKKHKSQIDERLLIHHGTSTACCGSFLSPLGVISFPM